jgi:hypothetical protein
MAANTHNASSSDSAQSTPQTRPLDGFVRWADLKRIATLSHESVRKCDTALIGVGKIYVGCKVLEPQYATTLHTNQRLTGDVR